MKEIKQATPTKHKPAKKEMQDLRILGEKVEIDSLPLATKNLKDCKGTIYVPFVEQFLSFFSSTQIWIILIFTAD